MSRLYILQLLARHCNLVSKPLHFSASSIPQNPHLFLVAAGIWYPAFVKLLAFWSCNWHSKSLLYFKMEMPPLEVDKELKHCQKIKWLNVISDYLLFLLKYHWVFVELCVINNASSCKESIVFQNWGLHWIEWLNSLGYKVCKFADFRAPGEGHW